MKVLWLTNIPSPYRVNFFNELGKLCQLTVLFEKSYADDRDESWKYFHAEHFTPVFLKGIKYGASEAFCPGVAKYLSLKKYDKIVITNYANFTGMLAVAVLRLRRIPYIIEGDGAFAGSGRGLKEFAKRWLFEKAALCFSTAEIHDEYYRTYGVPEHRIVRYPFTSLFAEDILREPISVADRADLRNKLGMTENRALLAVGQFVPRKGFDILLRAMAKLPPTVGCYIVGGCPPESYLAQVKELGLENVHFVDFMEKDRLAEYYMAADVFVHPTREDIWGLVINEAMAKGLPVVTTNRCVAGLTLITDHRLGAIVPVEDADALAKATEEFLMADREQTAMAVLRAISAYTFEEMAKRHIEVLCDG